MRINILGILFLIPLITFGQSSSIFSGKILARNNGEPLPFSSIYSKNYEINTITDELGYYELLINLEKKIPDSILISCIGFKLFNISTNDFITKKGGDILLEENEHSLENITVIASKLTWGEIIFRAVQKINVSSVTAFESIVSRKTEITQNSTPVVSFSLNGYGHDEGLDGNQLLQNRGEYSWFIYNKYNILLQKRIPDYDGGIIRASTYFESRAVKFLLPLSIAHYDYSLAGMELMGNDTVFKINVLPKKGKINSLNFVDKRLFSTLYSILLSKKIYYIHSKTFTILRIEFEDKYKRKMKMRNNIVLEGISGSVNFFNNNGSIHPTQITVYHNYKDKDNYYTRHDLIFFKNVESITLSNDEIKKKYDLSDLRNNFPGRRIFKYSDKYGNNSIFRFNGIELK